MAFGYCDVSKTLTEVWTIEDIRSIRPNYSEEQCKNALASAADEFDANEGINWEFLERICDLEDLYEE